MNRERIKIKDENKSIMLNTSPVRTKRPLTNKRKAQNKRYCGNTGIEKINIRNAIAAARSKAPRIFTNTIEVEKEKDLNN